MKKVYLFIGLALSMLAVGCSSDSTNENGTPVVPEGDVTVTVNATLAHEGLEWQEGDVVSINGASATVAKAGTTATLVVADVEAPLMLVAPASVATGLSEITLRGVQNYVEGGYDASAYVLYGGAATTTPVEGVENAYTAEISVNAASGVVSLPLTLDPATAENPVSVKSISLVSLDGNPLCGTFSVSRSVDGEGNLVANVTPAEASNVLDLVCQEGVELSVDTPVYFNFVVPAGLYAQGFELEIVDTENHHYLATTTLTAPVVPEPEPEPTPDPENPGEEPVVPASETVGAGVVAPASTVVLEPVVFTVVEKGPATLTVTIGEEAVKWAEGDAIVVNEELSSEVAAEAVGTSTATFNLTDVAYPYSVFYPAELYTTSGSLRFPDEQPIIAGGYDRSLLAMVGYSSTNEVTLHNLCGVVTIPFTNKFEGENILIEKIVVTSAMGDPITGKYHINYRTGKVSVVSGKSSVTLTNGSADEDCLLIAPQETASVSFVVPVGSVRNGLKVSVLSNAGLLEDLPLFTTGLDVRGGEEKIAETYEYKEVKIDAIRTADELLDFAKCVNLGRYKKYMNEDEGGAVILGGDIDMSTLTANWEPIIGKIDETTGIPLGFDGIFDGKGYKITNWATMQPLFGYVAANATVKNFVIDGSCGLTIPELSTFTIDGKPASNCSFGFAVATNFGVVEGITNNAEVTCVCLDDSYAQSRAAIVGYNAVGAYVRNCINNGSVTLDLANHTAQTAYIGTVVGRAASDASHVPCGLYNLENHGRLTINITDGITNKNFYIGGVSGSANSYTVVENCKNYADVTFNINNDTDKGALVCMGGVVGYSAGEITNCYNEGNIKHDGLCTSVYSGGAGDFKGTIVAGIVGYQNAVLSNCINKGNITITGNRFGGRNTVGSIDGTKSKSSAAPAAAGIVGYCYKATVDGCENYGKITYTQPNGDNSGTSGIHLVAGVVASPWGDVTNCKNFGEIEVTRKFATANVNSYLYVGGIAASDYYPLTQNESSIIDCVNEGNITVDNDLGTANSAYAGIIGWPGIEADDQTNVTKRCVNKGNIVLNGTAKARVGGIQGGAGSIVDCQNSGSITVNNSHADSPYGGLSGFFTRKTFCITGSTNTGDIIVNVPLTGASSGVGGLVGGKGNTGMEKGKFVGNKVNCTVRVVEACHGAGMIVGHFNGNSVMYFGTEESPIEVGGKLQIGNDVTEIDATNVNSIDVLSTGCANYDAGKHNFSTILAQ